MKTTPTITELKNIGFVDCKENQVFGSYLIELPINECADVLILRSAYDSGWFWSVNNIDNEPHGCVSLKRMSQILSLIDIMKGI